MDKIILFSTLIASAIAARPTWKDLDSYSFKKFLVDFGYKFVEGTPEFHLRESIFNTELARVRAHNAKNLSWKEGINKYSLFSTSEKKQQFMGRSKAAHAEHVPLHEKPNPYLNEVVNISKLPVSVDWREAGIVNAVKDQGRCGSCWAFASTSMVESYVAKNTGLLYDLSVGQMAMCAPNPDACGGVGKCEGSTPELAFDYVAGSAGMYEEYQYGYASYYGVDYDCTLPPTAPVVTIEGYTRLPTNDYQHVMNALVHVGPLAINVDASSWHAYESGVFDGCNQVNPDVNHVVVLVGYGEDESTHQKYWIVRNSWAPTWGEAGYIRIARQNDEDQLCGMDIDPTNGVTCKGKGETQPAKVCGHCGVIFDSSFPLGARLL